MATLQSLTISDTGYIKLPVGTGSNRPGSPVNGMIRYNTDTGLVEFYNGSIWQPMGAGGIISYAVDDFVGDGSTTVFTMSLAESSAEQIIVFVGSVYQQPVTAYTVNGGFDITVTSAPPNTVPINVIHSSN